MGVNTICNVIVYLITDHRILAQLSLLPYYLPPRSSIYTAKDDSADATKSNSPTKPKGGQQSKRKSKPEKLCTKFSSADAEKTLVQLIEVNFVFLRSI